MTSVLERNLEALLTRAWEPVAIRPEFRDELRARLMSRVAALREPARGRTLVATALRAAAAVMLGSLLALGGWRAVAPEARAATLDSILAEGKVAVRLPDPRNTASWRALTEREEPGGEIILAAPVVEVATPEARGARLLSVTGDSALLTPSATARFESTGTDLRARASSGGLSVHKQRYSPEWRVETLEGTIRLASGELALAYESPAKLLALGQRFDGISVDRSLVRLRLGRGVAELLTDTGPIALAAGVDLLLQAGHMVPADEDRGDTTIATTREPVTEPDTPREEPNEEPVARETEGARIEGRVVDATTGAPVERFRVAYRRELDLPKVTEPDAADFESPEGRFAVPGLDGGAYSVFVEAEGYAVWKARGRDLDANGVLDLTAELRPGARVEGFVVDAATGAPIPNALVLIEADLAHQVIPLEGLPEQPLPAAHAFTDAGGAFVLPHASAGEHALRASHPEYAPSWTTSFRVAEGGHRQLAPLELGLGGRIEGRIEHDDGSPWRGAVVIASHLSLSRFASCMTFGFAVSLDDGTYSIERLPAGFFVTMNLGEQPNEDPEWSRLQQTTITAGETSRVDFLGASHETRVFGTLLDADGAPLSGYTITLSPNPYAREYADWTATTVRADGSFEFKNVKAGDYGVLISTKPGEEDTVVRFLEVPDRTDLEVDLPLPRTEVSAQVTDRATGAPLETAWLILERWHDGTAQWLFAGRRATGADGTGAFFGVPAGHYRMSTFDMAGGLAQQVSAGTDVAVGAPARFDFELDPGGSLLVRVVDDAGAPIGGAAVDLVDENGQGASLPPDFATETAGNVRASGLPPGRWRAVARKAGYAPGVHAVFVGAGEQTEVTIVLQRGREEGK